MKSFELVLNNEKERQYRTIASLIILVNIFFFIWLAMADREVRVKAIGTAIIVLAGLVLRNYYKKFPGMAISIFFIVLFYLERGYWQFALVIGGLALLYIISVRRLIVKVSEQHIIYPSFPKREIGWNELNNLILKDGLLSIDFKNNRLAQSMIKANGSDTLDEKEFNEFCKTRLDLSQASGGNV